MKSKIEKVVNLMGQNSADVLMVCPSSGLKYLTGMDSFSCERFKALFILNDGRYFYISPEIYYEETREKLGENADIYTWGDLDGFLSSIIEADKKYRLSGKKIAVNDGVLAINMLDMENILDVDFVNGHNILEEAREIKSKDEMQWMRRASNIADEVMEEVIAYIRPGMMEMDIAKKAEELFISKGDEFSFCIAASGPNSSKPHYHKNDRVISERDIVVVDLGGRHKGYCSDISRTVFIGEPTDEQRKVFDVCKRATMAGQAAARKGITAEEVDAASRKVMNDSLYGKYFMGRTGHGIGVAEHEGPMITKGNKRVLEDGMCFSVEPGIYIEGKFGMRVENLILINNGEAEILNKISTDIIIK